jgi:hypothetical protein
MRPASVLKLFRFLAASAGAAVLVACGGGNDAPAAPPEPLQFSDVEVHAFSGVAEARNVTVNDELGWSSVWTSHTANVQPAPSRPQVELSTQSIAAVFLGKQTGCQRPLIDEVQLTPGQRVLVVYRVQRPGPEELCPPVVMTPVHMVRFPNAQRLPVEYRQR